MIPADRITFNDDGTAWWVPLPPYYDMKIGSLSAHLDRPCDRCYGRGAILVENQGEEPCPADCIDGRHTFTIEVETDHVFGFIDSFRVSIVPGMVLPIVEKWEDRPEVGPFITRFDGATRLWTDADLYEHIALPPATKAGMWAVKVRTEPENVEEPTVSLDALCETMHDAYEAAASANGWQTQAASAVPWSSVPEANKRTMRVAVEALLAKYEATRTEKDNDEN